MSVYDTIEGGRKNGAANKVQNRVSAVKEDAANLGRDIKRLSGAAGEAARERLHVAREQARLAASELGTRARGVAHDVETQIQRRPAAAVGIAAGVGLLLGWMLSRRH